MNRIHYGGGLSWRGGRRMRYLVQHVGRGWPACGRVPFDASKTKDADAVTCGHCLRLMQEAVELKVILKREAAEEAARCAEWAEVLG